MVRAVGYPIHGVHRGVEDQAAVPVKDQHPPIERAARAKVTTRVPRPRLGRKRGFLEQSSGLGSKVPVDIADLQDTASVTILRIGYRCGNLARTILRYADLGGAAACQFGAMQLSRTRSD